MVVEKMVMEPKVIFEDEYLLAVDKPAGMVVNRAETTKGKVTLQDWLEDNFQLPIFNFQLGRSGVVHRLDRETSGVLLVAKTPAVLAALQKLFKERKIQKTYLTLVHGQVRPVEGEIKAPISRNPFNPRRFGVFLGGREAVTNYQLQARFEREDAKLKRKEDFSLLEVYPKTGRTHQIRVHFKHIGHPLVADCWYGGRKTARRDRLWCPRLWLQAMALELIHPVLEKKLALKTELADDLQLVLKSLKRIDV
jgi:23S rRNA pseudouridine1911/1915/1917 synthase